MRSVLLLVACGLLFLSTPTAAQRPVDPAASRTTLRSSSGLGAARTPTSSAARYRYWEADTDSLRQVLATQRADTARLRTLMHLADVLPVWSTTNPNVQETAELAVLSAQLRLPEQRAYRLLASGNRLYQAKEVAPALDSLQAAVVAFDRLGRPVPNLLGNMRTLYNTLNQNEAKGTYYQAKLAYYRQCGAIENMATCHLGLGNYYSYQGDYNQAISHYLPHVTLLRTYNRPSAANQLAVVGSIYNDWGNTEKALHYLQRSVAEMRRWDRDPFFAYRMIAVVHLQRHEYAAALRALDQALRRPTGKERYPRATRKVHVFTLKGAVLLAQGQPQATYPLLQAAQHLADSLQLSVSTLGDVELDATWARYYVATGDAARAETSWLTAYRKAQQAQQTPLRLAYLRELTRFYQQQGNPGPAARYAVAALALADSLDTREGMLHVARYEIEQATQAQQARIAWLRQAQQQDAAQARRQRNILWAVLGGTSLIAGFSFLLWRSNRSKQRANEQLNQQKAEIQAQRDQTTQALTELRATQAQLIQKEKMASLGELTAGIAHEIQNPLNFVNNFSEVSAELVAELQEAQAGGDTEEVSALAEDLAQNLGKIQHHGQRAAGIVRGMLEHSRASTGERAPTDLNALADEYLRLAYQGLRAKDKSFNAALHTDFAPGLPLVEAVAGDVGRVLLNLFNNAFYAVQQRQQAGEAGFAPTVRVSTERVNGHVAIRVQDNGTGMNPEVQQKIFQPFFTTKPTGEGTGLGLSLSHDIITQGHGGNLAVESQAGRGSTFTISFPY